MDIVPDEQIYFENRIIQQVHLKLMQLAMKSSSRQYFESEYLPGRIFEGSKHKILLQLWDELATDDWLRNYLRSKYGYIYEYHYEDLSENVFRMILRTLIQDFFNQYDFREVPVSSITENQRERPKKRSLAVAEVFENEVQPLKNSFSKLIIAGKSYDYNITKLSLVGENLTSIPEEIGLLTSLVELDLTDNLLTELPREIGNLSNLKVLKLGANQLTTLPKVLLMLPNLRIIQAENNNINVETREAILSAPWREGVQILL